jgi:hypothetical protein
MAQEESAPMSMEVNTIEVPDLSALNGGGDSDKGDADGEGPVPVDECEPDSTPHRGAV